MDAVIKRLTTLFPDLAISKGSGNAAAQEWIGLINGMAWGIATIAIVIGGLGMMNTMVMSVFSVRARWACCGRRLGQATRVEHDPGRGFGVELPGRFAGNSAGRRHDQGCRPPPAYGSMFRGGYSAGLFVQGLVTALLLGTIGGIYPAWWASRLTPIEALR